MKSMLESISSLDAEEVQGLSEDEVREEYFSKVFAEQPALTDVQVSYSVRLFNWLWQRLLDKGVLRDMDGTGYFCPSQLMSANNGLQGLD